MSKILDKRHLALFPAETIARGPDHRESPARRGVVVITTAQLHSTKSELRFCAGSNSACGVLEIRDGEDL